MEKLPTNNEKQKENVRFSKILSNGDFLVVKVSPDGDIDIAIADDENSANEMVEKYEKGFGVSGRRTLEGLRTALKIINELKPEDFGGTLYIQPSDEERFRAYRYLERYGWQWNPVNGTYQKKKSD